MTKNIVGPPARGEDFFDREELLDLLWDRISAGNVLLAAPRRFGKTSLMYRLIDFPRAGWQPVHVDAESIREPANFIVAVLDALTSKPNLRAHLLAAWKKTGKWMRGLLEEAEITGPWDVGVKVKLKETLAPDWPERGAALLRVLRDLGDDPRLLLVIDELPLMLSLFKDSGVTSAEAKAFLYWFRKMRIDPEIGLGNCRFLIGGSIGIEGLLTQIDAVGSFNDFERVTLAELSDGNAARLVELLATDRKLALSAASRRQLLGLVGAPIPYFLQVFVSELANARAQGLATSGPKALERIYRDRILGVTCKTYFQHYYNRLRTYERQTEVLATAILKHVAVAGAQGVSRAAVRTIADKAAGAAVDVDALDQLLAELENDFYVRYDASVDAYVFASKVLRDWWRRYYAF